MTVGLNEDGISNYCDWNSTENAIKGVDVLEALMNIGANKAFVNMGSDDFAAEAKKGTVIAGVSGVWSEAALKEAWGSNLAATKLPSYTCAGQ